MSVTSLDSHEKPTSLLSKEDTERVADLLKSSSEKKLELSGGVQQGTQFGTL